MTSLDAESLTTLTGEHIDVPTRPFWAGYYPSLCALCKHLSLCLHRDSVDIRLTTGDASPLMSAPPPPESSGDFTYGIAGPEAVFIYPSSGILPPPPPYEPSIVTGIRNKAWQTYFDMCMKLLSPDADETLGDYLARINVSDSWTVEDFLPRLSSYTLTCDHKAVLAFPAVDALRYLQQTEGEPALLIDGGMSALRRRLLESGVRIRYGTRVLAIEHTNQRLLVHWESDKTDATKEWYTIAILAVPPNVVAQLYPRISKPMSLIPYMECGVVVHSSSTAAAHAPEGTLSLCTAGGRTEATRHFAGGVACTTAPRWPLALLGASADARILGAHRFTRVSRTLASREVAQCADGEDEGVYLVGAWCWDGLVLLEGCVRSAERVAKKLGCEVPWETEREDDNRVYREQKVGEVIINKEESVGDSAAMSEKSVKCTSK